MSPERNEYKLSFDEVVANAKDFVLKDGHHTPILIVEGSKNLIVSQIQEMPETHGERMEMMRFIASARPANCSASSFVPRIFPK